MVSTHIGPTPATARRTAALLGFLTTVVLGLTMMGGGASATAKESAPSDQPPSVIFLGDSVTAGFGYFGQKENAKNVTGTVNNEFPEQLVLRRQQPLRLQPAEFGHARRSLQQQQLQRGALERRSVAGGSQLPERGVLLPDRRESGPQRLGAGRELGGHGFDAGHVGRRWRVQLPVEEHQEHLRGDDAGGEPDPGQLPAGQARAGARSPTAPARTRPSGWAGPGGGPTRRRTSSTAPTSSGPRTSRPTTSISVYKTLLQEQQQGDGHGLLPCLPVVLRHLAAQWQRRTRGRRRATRARRRSRRCRSAAAARSTGRPPSGSRQSRPRTR